MTCEFKKTCECRHIMINNEAVMVSADQKCTLEDIKENCSHYHYLLELLIKENDKKDRNTATGNN